MFFLIFITLLIHKQIRDNHKLSKKVIERTKEIETIKKILQKTIDSECICDIFEKVDYDDDFLHEYVKGIYWIDYIKREQHNRQLKDLTYRATTDPLTKLLNRNKFNKILSNEIELCNTIRQPLCIVFVDIDFFKKVNDTYGHETGDKVLVECANIFQTTLRDNDFVSRWGGEEFIITLQSTQRDNAFMIAQKIRKKVQEHQFVNVGHITISLGVTQYIYNETQENFINRADNALYQAKENGRNRVEEL